MHQASILVNGADHGIAATEEASLLRVLREDLDLTGTKTGCEAQACGACTVLIDGHAGLACAVTIGDVRGREVTTIEGLAAQDGTLHAVQQAFLDEQAVQCGWCTPGQILTAVALLAEIAEPDEDVVRDRMSSVLCRCGTYQRVIAAVLRASRRLNSGAAEL